MLRIAGPNGEARWKRSTGPIAFWARQLYTPNIQLMLGALSPSSPKQELEVWQGKFAYLFFSLSKANPHEGSCSREAARGGPTRRIPTLLF